MAYLEAVLKEQDFNGFHGGWSQVKGFSMMYLEADLKERGF